VVPSGSLTSPVSATSTVRLAGLDWLDVRARIAYVEDPRIPNQLSDYGPPGAPLTRLFLTEQATHHFSTWTVSGSSGS